MVGCFQGTLRGCKSDSIYFQLYSFFETWCFFSTLFEINGLKIYIFSSLLSEGNMGIDYFDNILDQQYPFYLIYFSVFLDAGGRERE